MVQLLDKKAKGKPRGFPNSRPAGWRPRNVTKSLENKLGKPAILRSSPKPSWHAHATTNDDESVAIINDYDA